MSKEVAGSGAPYNIIVTLPDINEQRIYNCADKETTLNDLTTLALVHINGNIREKTGVRMLFEIVAAPVEVSAEEKKLSQSAEVADAPVPATATDEEIPDGTVDGTTQSTSGDDS